MPDLVKKWREQHPYLSALEDEINADYNAQKYQQEKQNEQYKQQRKEYEQWVEANQYGPYGDERDRTAPRGVSNALTPEMEYRHQQASGGGNRLTPYQVAMQAATAATPPTPETRSTDELRRDMNRQNRIARGTERMTVDMAGQGLRDQSLLFNPTYTSNLRTMGQTMEAQQAKADRATELYQTLSVQRREQEEREKFSALLQNPDFAAKSQGDPTIGKKVSATSLSPAERLYQNIYNHGGEKTNAKDRNAAEFVSDEEAGIFFYLWNTQGPKAAQAYYNGYVDNRASQRRAEAAQAQAEAFGHHDILGSSAESVVANAVSGVGLVDMAWQNIARSVGLTDKNKPLNYYSSAQLPGLVSDAIRKGAADEIAAMFPKVKIGKGENAVNVASFLYETGMSMADSSVAILLNTVGIPEAATLGMMGAAAGTRAIRDARERGASDGQALAFGVSSAIMEALFEKISLDRILTESNAHNLAQSILGTLKQGFTEGSEEVMTTLANTAADMFIMGDKAEVFAMQRRLMEQGVSEKEALKAALTQWGTGILGDAIGGFISGAGMGGVKEFFSARNNPLYQWNMPMAEARALQNIEQNGLPQERGITPELQRNIEAGIRAQNERETAQDRAMLAEDAATQREATQRRAAPPLPQQARQITPESVTTPPVPQSVQTAQDQSERLNAGTAQSGKDNTRLLWTAPKDNGGWKRQYNGDTPMLDALKATNEELLAAYMSEATEGNTDTPVIDAVIAAWEDVRQGTISPMAGAELVNQMWQAGKDDASRRAYLQSIYNPSTGNLTQQALKAARNIDIKHRGGLTVGQADNPAAAVGQQANAGQNENASATEAAEAGNDLADGGRGRLSGQRDGEQDGRLAEAKRAVSQYNKASGRRADAKNLRAEEVDARDHIAEAAKGSKITIAPEQMVQQDKELRTVAQRLEEITGKKVYYTIGNIQRQGADGSVSQARGAITADGIYLRCDHNDLSVTQIGAHELYHYYEDLYPGLSARMKEKIIQTYSEEEFNKVAQVYVKKLGAICGLSDNQDALAREEALASIEREIFADAFGSINFGGAKADKFNALVRQTVSDTMGAETAAATERRTGPPETQFSLKDVTKIRNITKDTAGSYGNNPKTRFLRNASMPKVAETKPDVKTGFSADEEAVPYNRTAMLTEETVDRWIRDYASASSPKYAQAYITRMSPNQFLKLTTSRTGRLVVGSQTGPMDAEKLIEATRQQPLQLRISNGEVVGHEGRHRATALDRANVRSIPVLIFDSSNKNSKTDVPEMVLQGQDFGSSRSYDKVTLENLVPLSYENRDRIVQEYGKQDAFERSAEKLGYRQTVRFSMDEETDAEYIAAAEAGDMETAQRLVDEAAEAAGYTIHAYHGTGRADRVGNVFRADRATSGPMAFFTDSKDIAENYSRDKRDTSLAYDTDYDSYETQFRAKHTKTGKDFAIYKMWGYIPLSERAKIKEKARHVRENWEGEGEIIYDPQATEANGGWSHQLQEFKGDVLKALNEQWLNSGYLFNKEEQYLKVLELAGVTDALKKAGFEMPRYMNPDYREEAVYDVFLKIQNPFDATSMIDEDFIQGFEDFAVDNEERFTKESVDADYWDKNSVSAEEFAERMRNDLERGATHAWTSIPDVMSEYLKTLGYDGIKDAGGKNGGQGHTVWIPFTSEQIKRTDPITYDDDGNIIPLSERFNPQKQDIRWSADEEEIPQSAAEYARMKERDREREAELRRLEKSGKATEEQKKEAAALRKKNKAPKAAERKQQATIAKKDLRNTIISQFGIPNGRKAEIGSLIDAYADRIIRDKRLTYDDQKELFDKLYSEGVMTVPADDMYQAAREIVRGGKVYVPESVKHEFSDDWNDFRRQAFAEGIYLTNNPADKSADSWNVELSSEFPGLFPEDNYDQKDILERIVSAAQAGRDEQLSLAEYAAKVVGQEYVSEDDMMDNMERQLDWALRTFAEKAGLEIYLRDRIGKAVSEEREKFGQRLDAARAQEIARQGKEREKRKEAARRQARNRELREMQERTLKQLQWLSRNRQKFSGNMQDRLNEILSDIDVYAISAADEAHLDKASNKTWRELADIYKDARENDPNFLPSKDLERIVARLDNRKIGDMDIDAVTDLYKAAVGLRTELYNRNNVIGSELHETFQEVYDQVKDEMQKAKGGYQTGAKGKAQKFFSDLQLTPMNVLERMAGWNKDSAWYKMAKQLEQGERAQRKFKTDSARMLAPFLEEHKEWVKKADGQGKDAIWYEVEVPELLELGMGDKPIFGNTVKVYMTPAQKVHMYLESQNYDNLRHMTGGRTFADKELYSKGKRAEAFAQGKTIRLAPETVKNLVKDLTPEEKAMADALRPFYNEFSKKEINRVSNLLLGYNKAMEGDYAPIYTNQNYTKSEPGIFDTTAEGVGNLKSRVVSANPSLNISALDAFEKSVDRTSRYVGLAVPVRNMNTLMNWREKGNSMADVLTHKWGEDGKRFVNDLLTELQSGRETEQSSIEKMTNAALSRYISAVFGANPSIVMKQFASYPLAAAYLGGENMPLNVPRAARVDTDLIAKYTGEYDYRQLGYAMPETATLKDNPGKLQERGPLNFIFGGGAITWMDGFTVRTLWTWAENKVNKEQPGLEKGSQADIDAGNSEYYNAVAAEFEEALSRSQPMYDTMHRANIMRESNPITRAFTLFKTVPMQEYNMLRQAIGEAQYAKEAKLDKETQAAARQKAGRAFAGILTGNLMIGAITVLNALWKNRGKKYRDEDGELSAEKLIAEAGKQYFKDAAGLVIGGGEAADILSSILFGDKWYGLETPGMEQIGSILEQTVKAGQTVGKLVQDSIEVLQNGGNWAQYMADHSDTYLSAVDSVARTLGTYATGLPIDNVKAYLLGAVQWLSPEVKTAYEDIMDKADRSGLKGLSGASLEIRTKHILQERAGSADEETAETLAGLYEAGYKDAIPAAQQTKVSIDGEERHMNLAQQQTYKRAWQSTVGGSIDELVGSKDFQNADEATQAKMLKKLYDLANKKAASALFDDYEDSAIGKADAYTEAGASLADYAAMSGAVSGQKRAESYETILGSDMSDEAKLAAIGNIIGTDMVTETGNPTQWARLNTAVKDGLSVDRAMELMQGNLLDDYVKFSDAGVDSKNADNIVTAISKLKPEEGYEEVRGVQKWNAIIGTVRGSANQEKALQASMTESQWKAYKDSGVGAELYVKFKYDTRNYTSTRDAEGKEVKGQAKKDKMIAYIDGLNASTAQKDALYLTEYKESGLSDTPWHKGGGKGSGSYAPARLVIRKTPEAPQATKPRSGLVAMGQTKAAAKTRGGLVATGRPYNAGTGGLVLKKK